MSVTITFPSTYASIDEARAWHTMWNRMAVRSHYHFDALENAKNAAERAGLHNEAHGFLVLQVQVTARARVSGFWEDAVLLPRIQRADRFVADVVDA